jgi:hypothetical protein
MAPGANHQPADFLVRSHEMHFDKAVLRLRAQKALLYLLPG